MKNKKIKTRDHLMVKVINGATKGGPHKNHKKEANKKASRLPVLDRDEEFDLCRQCHFPLRDGITTSRPDSFCSDTCRDFYNEQLGE